MLGFIVHPHEGAGRAVIGGKAESLARLEVLGPVPPWFAVSAAAFGDPPAEDAGDEGQPPLPPPEKAAALIAAARALAGPGGLLAVRSSCVDEDGARHSFAGQYLSRLNVRPEDVPEAAIAVWRSGFSDTVRAYRRAHALAPARAPAIIVQRMVAAERAGVAFGADPVMGRRDRFIVSAVRGLADGLVAGKESGDSYVTDRNGTLIEKKTSGGVPCLSVQELREIARMLRNAEQFFGSPQDMEWAIADGRLWLLQSRPVTVLGNGEAGILWDNSNLVESYSGVTTPLTFTFARSLYERVYRQMAQVLGVKRGLIEHNAHAFRNMIGMIRGRMYYNLLNWYRCLSLLPGFGLNRRLMEQMMGVDRSLPGDFLARLRHERAETAENRFADAFSILRMIGRMIIHRLTLPRARRRFHARVDLLLGRARDRIAGASLPELACLYRSLERNLIERWSVPLVNDLYCMLSFGLLRRALARWADDKDGAFCNALLAGQGGVISAVPAREIVAMARLTAAQPGLRELIRTGPAEEALAALRRCGELSRRFNAWLDRFGDRCPGELKLESPSLREDPSPLLHAIAAAEGGALAAGAGRAANAHRRLGERLKRRPLRRLLVRMLLVEARARIRDRENMRFERTRVFGAARRIFVEMGRRLAETGHLSDARDVFYLTTEEIFGFLDGTIVCPDLSGLAALRRQRLEAWTHEPPLPRRFETRGAAGMERIYAASPAGDETDHDGGPDTRRGQGCAPGMVEGPVRVVADPRATSLAAGEILVTAFTDPGWVTLMAQASGMIVERGSLLSHSAIVARELGIPTIIGVEGVTAWLRDGDRVLLDGATGRVRIIRAAGGRKAA